MQPCAFTFYLCRIKTVAYTTLMFYESLLQYMFLEGRSPERCQHRFAIERKPVATIEYVNFVMMKYTTVKFRIHYLCFLEKMKVQGRNRFS